MDGIKILHEVYDFRDFFIWTMLMYRLTGEYSYTLSFKHFLKPVNIQMILLLFSVSEPKNR